MKTFLFRGFAILIATWFAGGFVWAQSGDAESAHSADSNL
jgi:hypothetical protein